MALHCLSETVRIALPVGIGTPGYLVLNAFFMSTNFFGLTALGTSLPSSIYLKNSLSLLKSVNIFPLYIELHTPQNRM